jgi:hypothetical protein
MLALRPRIQSLFAWSVRQLSDLGEEDGATIIVMC